MVQIDDIAVCWVGLGGTKVRNIAEALECLVWYASGSIDFSSTTIYTSIVILFNMRCIYHTIES